MQVYKIAETLSGQYKGSGYALAAIMGGQVVAVRYLADLLPDPMWEAISDTDGAHGALFVRQWLQTAEAAPVVREMQALGAVSVGMCSAWEFCEL